MTSDGSIIGAVALYVLLALIGTVAGAAYAGWWTWHHAPPVGGEWWPYIHVGATFVATLLGAKLGALAGAIAGFILGGLLTILGAVIGT